MSELKRAPITTISEGSKEKSGSIRLELRLFEPTLEEFPEFNYQALIHGEKVNPVQHKCGTFGLWEIGVILWRAAVLGMGIKI